MGWQQRSGYNSGYGSSPKSKALRRADEAFSKYIRTRDSQKFKGRFFKCISCGEVKRIEKCHNGHYINRQHMALRFNELNCNAQCSHCNSFMEGNIPGYRRGLIAKIGLKKVEMLEAFKRETNHLSEFDLDEIAKYYRKKTKEFKYQIGGK